MGRVVHQPKSRSLCECECILTGSLILKLQKSVSVTKHNPHFQMSPQFFTSLSGAGVTGIGVIPLAVIFAMNMSHKEFQWFDPRRIYTLTR